MAEHVKVAVIGAGPAGLAAALEAKKWGAGEVMLLDRNRELGGILNQCIHNGFGLHRFKQDLTGPEYAHRFVREVEKRKIRTKLDTVVLEVSPQGQIIATNKKEGIFSIKAKSVVLAMGCRERTREMLCIPGYRPSGILPAGLAQEWVNLRGYLPGKNVVVLGSGDIGLIMARRLTLEGAQVKAVVEILAYPGGLTRNVVQCLQDFDIPLLLEHTVSFIHGKDRVQGVTVSEVDRKKQPVPGKERFIPCDTLILSVGLIPENELSLGAGIEIDPATGGPLVDERMHTNIEEIFACGNVVQVQDLVDYVSFQAEIAGKNAALYALGRLPSARGMIRLTGGRNVGCIVPQFVFAQGKTTVFIRVEKPERKVSLVLGDGLKKKNIPVVRPNQMIVWEVPFGDIDVGGARELEIKVVKR